MPHLVSLEGDDLYLDDRDKPVGYLLPTVDDSAAVGEMKSPDGYTARDISDSMQAVIDKFQQWGRDGLPRNSPLVREWNKAEELIAWQARLWAKIKNDL